MSRHPLPFIPELKKIIRIKGISDILFINDFVYSLIPHDSNPHKDGRTETINFLYNRFKNNEFTGWCGLNVVILRRVLEEYGIKTSSFNYGLSENNLTHVVVQFAFNDETYLIDPFFNKYYTDKKGIFLTFKNLILNIVFRKFDDIIPVYGNSKKRFKTENDEWVKCLPEALEMRILKSFYKAGLKEKLKVFDSDNPLFLMLFPVG